MKLTCQINQTFKATPEKIYSAWLDSAGHSDMTGGEAICGNEVGDKFTAWDGYISGENISLVANEKIIQSWRTADFDADDEDSQITILFETAEEGCLVTLIHNNIPINQPDYQKGWVEHYFDPMLSIFN